MELKVPVYAVIPKIDLEKLQSDSARLDWLLAGGREHLPKGLVNRKVLDSIRIYVGI